MPPTMPDISFYATPNITIAAETLAALHQRCFSAPWDVQNWQALITRPTAILGVLSATHSHIDGIILIDKVDREAEILTFGIDPNYQRYGYGRMLLQRLIKTYPCDQYTLEVATDNIAAINLYQSIGFETVSVRQSYYREYGISKNAAIMSYICA